MVRHHDVVGRYVTIEVDDCEYKVFYLQNGKGIPLICQHTAGCHNHQWRGLLEDPEITKNYNVIAYDFALRASANTWKEFSQPIPKPMYHGIWSASFRKDLKIEGNHLVLMKNLRNFTVQFELLRKTGVPV